MLILTRHVGQSVYIGDDITVKITAIINGNNIEVGIEAPKDIRIHREEIKNKHKARKSQKKKPSKDGS